MKLLMAFGLKKEQLYLVDTKGIVHEGRPDLDSNPYKLAFANKTDKRTLSEAMMGADVFIGVSGPNLLSAEQLASMAPNPIIFALSNPVPEIMPHLAKQVRQDLIIATGRSDFPNQVNNLLCFPYIFRGALDIRARHINQAMKVAAVEGIRQLAKEPIHDSVLTAYELKESLHYGKDYILPKPTDPRLISIIPAMVARAAIETKEARQAYPAHYPVEFAPKE
jgi:malate dehydrogenase (oxaloacetate-decarboxylating)(NADP+)